MEVKKTNEQFQITDTYSVNDTNYNISGNATKGTNSLSIWFSAEGLGSVSYSQSSNNNSMNVESYVTSAGVPFKMFLNDMYDKVREIVEFVNE